ncbi:hypothetical protein GOBAR_AA07049 [Gossypium barbadense]|uniref:Uncharacterized protein n=1 Tax=Gossypium barbadense TaxID=3634 RepID=A0A2P5YD76_GOSBA|nr:hypothetical protein GOBAR_AA07049 [Gossypium barbadense]
MVQPTLQELNLKEVREPFSSNNRGPIHEERRLQIEELDEWRTHKPRTHDKPKLHQNKLNTFPNQLKVRDNVLLDAADPHIVTAKPNEEIPLTVLSIFPFGTVEVSHPKFSTFKVYHVVFMRKESRRPYFKEKEEVVIFLGLVRQLNILEFGTALGIYTKEFIEEIELHEGERALALSTLTSPTFYGYRLAQSTEEAPEDITDDVPLRHEDPPSQPPPPSRLVHAAASYADISELLTRFEQQFFSTSITLMLLYSRFFSTSTSHRHPTSRTI